MQTIKNKTFPLTNSIRSLFQVGVILAIILTSFLAQKQPVQAATNSNVSGSVPASSSSFKKTSPANAATKQPTNPKLSWGTSSGASSYKYCINTTASCKAPAAWISTGTKTSVTLSGLIQGKKYYWQVQSSNADVITYANGSSTAWWSLTIATIPSSFKKISPTNPATMQPTNPTLNWGTSSGTSSYKYCINTTASCKAPAAWISTGTKTSVTLSGLTKGTKYYWQVRSSNAAGTTYANGSSTAWWSLTLATTPTPTKTSVPPIPTPTTTPVPTQDPNGNTYYVATNGNDANPGTLNRPWQTIQKAAKTMIAGDSVVVQAGNYSTQRVQVTQSGSSGATIIYQANGTVTMKGFNIQANYITIQGFEIANTDYQRWNREKSSGIYVRGSNNVIENNYIHDNSLDGIFIYGPPSDPTASSNNIIRNNRLYHNELAGIEVNGRDNLIEGNEVWGTVQCHPNLTKVEDVATDNNGQKCPNYPAVSGLDADGMRFFGQGHVFRGNSIHDIPLGAPGINPAIGDYNDNPHIDCFQTWSGSDYEVAQNIIFEQNYCENLTQGMAAFMLGGGANNLTIRNNIIKAFRGVNTGSTGQHHLYFYNNLWINDLSIVDPGSAAIVLYNTPYSRVENNIFYNQPNATIDAIGDTTGQVIDYNLAFNSNGSNADCMRVGGYVCANPLPAHDMWNVDPRFTKPAISDYHLQSNSPVINAGVAVPVTNDYDGNPRPLGGGFEIGAYEFSASP